MRDAQTELRIKYISLLSGIQIDGANVPIYSDEVNDTISPYTRDNPPHVYIILSNQTSTDESTKCYFGGRYSMQVDSYTTYPAYNGSFVKSELLNNLVKQRILTNTSGNFPLTTFEVTRSRIDLTRNLSEKTKEQNIYRTITIFNHSIQEI